MAKRKVQTITLANVKQSLRRGEETSLRNYGGWCVFVNSSREHFYVVDDANHFDPVPFEKMRAFGFSSCSMNLLSTQPHLVS